MTDNPNRKRVPETSPESREVLEMAVEQSEYVARTPQENPGPILCVSEEYVVQYSNAAAEEVWRPWNCHVGQKVPLVMQGIVSAALADGTTRQQEVAYDGRVFWLTVKPCLAGRCVNLYGWDITDRKRTEEELDRAKQEWERTFDAVPDLIAIIDPQHRILRANRAMAERLGTTPEQCAGLTCYGTVHGLNWPPSLCPHAQTLADGREHVAEVHEPRLGGWFIVTCNPLFDQHGRIVATVHVARDITDRKRMEAALQQLNGRLEQEVVARTAELTQTVDRLYDEVARRVTAEGRLRKRSQMLEAFFQHTITPLAIMDWSFDFVRVNEAYAGVAGKDPDYFVGKNHFALYPQGENQAIFEQVVRTKQPYRAYAKPFSYPDDPKRGVTYWNWQLTPLLDEHEGVEFLVLNLEDVTEQQEALQESQERARQLQQLTLELSQAEDRERKRLAEILHDDLQQMLAAAKFHIDLLGGRTKRDPEAQKMAAVVKDLLKQAIDKSRSLSHELSPPALAHSDLYEAFEWLAQQMQTKHGLTVRLDACTRVELESEPLKAILYKAVQEMLFNVIKHAKVREARLRLRRHRDYVCLAVSDEGQGFEPQGLGKSSGFGLLGVRERIKLLGGRMKVRSAMGKGSTFFIVVPDDRKAEDRKQRADDRSDPPSVLRPPSSGSRPASSGRALRVLLVDDHKIVREGLESVLVQEQDIEIIGHAGNGREAVDLALELQPDIVVMDVALPVMRGDEATRQIKLHLPDTRIVALSMFDDPRTAERMCKAGAAAYLLKTAPSADLLAAIRGGREFAAPNPRTN